MANGEAKHVVVSLTEKKMKSGDFLIVLGLSTLFIILFLPLTVLIYHTNESLSKTSIKESCEKLLFHEFFNEIKLARVLLAVFVMLVFLITLKFIVLFMLLHILIEKWDLRPTVLILMLLVTFEIVSFVLIFSFF